MDSTVTGDAPNPMTAQHKFFDVVVILKGLNGVLELFGGTALLLIPAGAIIAYVDYLTRNELSGDPTDFFANMLIHWAANFTHGSQVFAAVYLLFHGVAKTTLATLLFIGRKIAYPIAIVFFTLFVFYACYRLLYLHWSWVLALAVAWDIFTIIVIAREWRVDPQAA